ncbi:Rossmann-like and DUF2520 domain-containing protein [Gaopeijia maritima]|uniref:Rossmann-like and DUF2520 domain-containing protein n=1 Tax=Gaopeijia maritima TaxID=3119007 RepID=A0ABU9EC48_9BACT
MIERVMVIGPGRVGLALGHALSQADAVRHLVYCGRRPEPPSHPLFVQGVAEYHFGLMAPPLGTEAVLLTLPDRVLPEMAHALAGQGRPAPDTVVMHTSGSLNTDVLAPLHAAGYAVGSIHPLQTISHPVTGAERLRGAHFAVTGEAPARRWGRTLARELDGRVLEVPVARRPLYHAAAVLASNGVSALLTLAAEIMMRSGVEPDEVPEAIAALARASLDDGFGDHLNPGFTGPALRGEAEAVGLHLRALEGDAREVYRALSGVLADLAERRGLPQERADAIRSLLHPPRGGSPEEAT